ncbi:hypothetical protein G6F37_006832 [Rhizopus arrhizus]|nr:hypothetical protein G6F38_007037 [Rhizopus arrhizus]KAG1157299.1 hypothetical protein G6F37_006832 [Rhizopus arrhizus]
MLDLVNTVYESIQELKSTVQKRANELNFSVSTKRSNHRSVYIQCIYGGFYRNTHRIENKDRKRRRTTKKIGCEWLLAASLISERKKWVIRSVSDINAHNHPLPSEDVYKQTLQFSEKVVKNFTKNQLEENGQEMINKNSKGDIQDKTKGQRMEESAKDNKTIEKERSTQGQ